MNGMRLMKAFKGIIYILTLISLFIFFDSVHSVNVQQDLLISVFFTLFLLIILKLSLTTYTDINFSVDFIVCIFIIVLFDKPVAMISVVGSLVLLDLFFKKRPPFCIENLFNFVTNVFTVWLIYFIKQPLVYLNNMILEVIVISVAFIVLNASINALYSFYIHIKGLNIFFNLLKYYSKTFLPGIIINIVFVDLFSRINKVYLILLFITVIYIIQKYLELTMTSYESRRFNTSLMDNTNLGILIFDNKDTLKSYNRLAEKYYGDSSDLKDIDLKDLAHGETTVKVNDYLLRLNTTLLHDDHKNFIGTIVIIEDITEKQEMEDKARLLDKLSIAGELSASVAHEVRNPLTTIKGFVTLMHQRHLKGKEDEFVQIVLDDIERISYVLSEFIGLAKPLRFDITDVDVSHVLNEAILLEEPNAIMHDIHFYKSIAAVPLIKADAEKLKQAFLNIIHNAVQATKEDGYVKVDSKYIDGLIVLTIEDNGSGMSEYDAKRVFEPFFTTKKDGNGLGLAVTYRLITEVKGTIDVKSKLGEGTTFTIRIPAAS